MRKVFSVLLIGLITVLFACEKEEGEDVEGSSNSLGTSHDTGKNCMCCHSFSAAGSVLNKDMTATST